MSHHSCVAVEHDLEPYLCAVRAKLTLLAAYYAYGWTPAPQRAIITRHRQAQGAATHGL